MNTGPGEIQIHDSERARDSCGIQGFMTLPEIPLPGRGRLEPSSLSMCMVRLTRPPPAAPTNGLSVCDDRRDRCIDHRRSQTGVTKPGSMLARACDGCEEASCVTG